MKYSLILGFSAYLFATNAFANSNPIVFPGPNDLMNKKQCIEIQSPCSFDDGKTCTKKYCGVQIKQATLDQFVKEHRLLGRKFPSLFDLQTYLKKTLPPDLQGMSISFSYKKNANAKNYNPNRINVLLDSKEYISKLIIG